MGDYFASVFLLLAGHAVGDFGLQNDWTARNKNRHVRDSFTPEQRKTMAVIWPYILSAHALIHGFCIYLITHRFDLSFLEFIAHWITDFAKCEEWFGFHTDQWIHIATKFVWAYFVVNQIQIF